MNETRTIRRREFKPDVPAPLLRQCKSDGERWMYEQASIHRQQNEAIMDRLDEGDARFDEADRARAAMREEMAQVRATVANHERIKERVLAKRSLLAFIAASLLGPVALAFIGAAFVRWWEKVWK